MRITAVLLYAMRCALIGFTIPGLLAGGMSLGGPNCEAGRAGALGVPLNEETQAPSACR
jgi:hypothetical protein